MGATANNELTTTEPDILTSQIFDLDTYGV